MKVFVSGGGTGGHFFPALALIECLLEKSIPTTFIGSRRGIEQKLKSQIPVEALFLSSHPFMGRGTWEKLVAVLKNLSSTLGLLQKLRGESAGVVFGGYASLPLGLSCILRKKPLYLHEQNSVPSESNRLLSKFAKRVFITFESSRVYFPREKVVKVGLPVRKRLLEGRSLSVSRAREELGLEEGFTLLVMGGSQGASFLNRLALEVFSQTGWQGIHLTGERDYTSISSYYKERGIKVLTLPFSHSMEVLYRASDIAISRAGASSITELSLFGVPALFIPFPHAVYDHQFYNAKEIEELGGGLILREREADTEKVILFLEKLARDREAFSERIKTFANPVACELMLEYILKGG
ncbi:MAG: undecaprenyldiphospho-muramoylpentapeptide beta-N-acetylglucosaminyltransferase [Aquificaceae bacterium]|nr:undecaprenyldiphospho-muramoylpentapeptide beta-N-acetylglucosaminyltransferase [Aquificaceae bacterium]MDW8032388.1 undecaprenyldiphospho-muramoylpentapeptide beta-N-acetylglucosaminyltransferase [Aquificaceae bacterium]MDW8294308.1 undecaprenyldiphospho-muramoylpentapeptide beta-N-acetylglucosaminyltransferase [Aquificaceae bacterium]